MQTLTTLYKKQGLSASFWRIHLQLDNNISIIWGMIGKSYGGRIKSFENHQSAMAFYTAFTKRLGQSYDFKPTKARFKAHIRVSQSLSLNHTSEEFVDFSYPIYSAIEGILEDTGNGCVGSMTITDHILSVPFMVVDCNLALNRIREALAGLGISRNRILFLHNH